MTPRAAHAVAPPKALKAPITQMPKNGRALGSSRATMGGVRKIPMPSIEPMTMVIEESAPMTRGLVSWGVSEVRASELMGGLWG
jgi:hypothetical protein